MLVGVLLDEADVRLARLEGAVAVLEGLVEVDCDDIIDGDHGGLPATILHTAVEPVDVAVRTVRTGDVRCKIRSDGARHRQ